MNPYENINYWQNLQQQQQQPQQTNSQIILQRIPVTQTTPAQQQQQHQVQTILTTSGQQFHQLTPAAQPETATNLSTSHFLTFVHSAAAAAGSTPPQPNYTPTFTNFQQPPQIKQEQNVIPVQMPSGPPPKPKAKSSPKTPKTPKEKLPAPKVIKPVITLKKVPQADKHKMGPRCDRSNCPGSYCCERFNEDTRRVIFNDFWNTLNSDQRHIFVANLVFAKPMDRRIADDTIQTEPELAYMLRNSNGCNEQVCQVMFLNTLDITQKQVNFWMKKYGIGGDGISKAKLNYKEQLQPVIRFIEDPNKPPSKKRRKKVAPEQPQNEYYHNPDEAEPNSQEYSRKLPQNELAEREGRKRRAADYFDPNCPNKPKRSKAIVQPELWKSNIKKTLRLEGKAYITQTKTGEYIQVKGKQLGPACQSQFCLKIGNRFCNQISQQTRERIFSDIWQRMDWEQRKVFVASMISRRNIKRRRSTALESRRHETLIYHLPNDEGVPIQICQKMFCSTTGISKIQTLRWTKQFSLGSKVEQSIIAAKDSTYHANEWLDTLPKIVLDGKTFLEPHFTIFSEVYHVYEKKFPDMKLIDKFTFRKAMRSKNLNIIGEQFDEKCLICEKETKSPNPFKRHTTTVENSEQERTKDEKQAKGNKAILLFLHLQPVRVIPFLKENTDQMYKSKLLCFNLTVYDYNQKYAYCYCFSEDQIGETITPPIITTIIIKFIKDNYIDKLMYNGRLPPIIMYSNGTKLMRNITLSNALLNLTLMYKNLKIIQKFSEINHHLVEECFQLYKIIDRHLNTSSRELYIPSQLAKSIREIKRNQKNFTAYHLDYEEFENFDSDEFLYASLNPGGDGLDEQDIRSLKYENDKIFLKFDYNDEWMELLYGRNVKYFTDFKKPIFEYPKLFTHMSLIRKSKWDDLQDLKKFIPYDCQQFYNSLKYYED